MPYTIAGLKTKILEMYPEIEKFGVESSLVYDKEKKTYFLKLTKGVHELGTYIDKVDADRCIQGHVCVALGIQVGQFLDNFRER